MLNLSPKRRLLLRWLTGVSYFFATLQVTRFYMATIQGLDMNLYLKGLAPLPFQKRYLPAVLIRAILRVGPLVRFMEAHSQFSNPPARFCELVLSALALGIAGYFCRRLYLRVSSAGRLAFLIYPLFLMLVLVSYAVHVEQNTNLPYDFPSLAFFAAGTYFIYTRQFLPLLLIVFFGTSNRETTLFLIPLFMLDAASRVEADTSVPWLQRFRLSQIPWLRTALLALTWFVVEATLSHMFAHNDRSQTHIRVRENIWRTRIGTIPVILNICGYLLPIILLAHPAIRPTRFGNYALIAIPWVIVMFFYGIVIETRIYGELVPYVTVACILLVEQIAAREPSTAQLCDATVPLPADAT